MNEKVYRHVDAVLQSSSDDSDFLALAAVLAKRTQKALFFCSPLAGFDTMRAAFRFPREDNQSFWFSVSILDCSDEVC